MTLWRDQLEYDPIQPLILSKNNALIYHTKRTLLDEKVPPIETLWELNSALKIIKKQKANGSWAYRGGKEIIRSRENYNQLETYRQLGFLIENFGFNNSHTSIEKAAQFLFSFQTDLGDFRGIYGTQYTPNYSAGICELLIKAGYYADVRIKKCIEWLLASRQNDGGWAIPIRTHNCKWQEVVNSDIILEPRTEKPFSHIITGVVLRAFAAHPYYRKSEEIRQAALLLLDNFFQNDNYPDRKEKSFWTKFTFPFWFTDLLSALDSIYFIDIAKHHPNILKSLEWFKKQQQSDGMWDVKILKTGVDKDIKLWIGYLICLTFKRFLV